MSCERYKNLIIISIYGELTSPEKTELENHLIECTICTLLYTKRPQPTPVLEDIPMPDWESSFEVITRRTIPRKRVQMVIIRNSYKKWLMAAIIVLAVFVTGYFFGGGFITQSPGGNKPGSLFLPSGTRDISLQSYAEHLEPVLVEFANHNRGRQPGELLRLRQTVLREILEQTRILKQLTSSSEDSGLLELLEDLEIILVGISNTRPGDRHAVDFYIKKIKEKGVRLKIRALASPENPI